MEGGAVQLLEHPVELAGAQVEPLAQLLLLQPLILVPVDQVVKIVVDQKFPLRQILPLPVPAAAALGVLGQAHGPQRVGKNGGEQTAEQEIGVGRVPQDRIRHRVDQRQKHAVRLELEKALLLLLAQGGVQLLVRPVPRQGLLT